jgi:hypothetical protein
MLYYMPDKGIVSISEGNQGYGMGCIGREYEWFWLVFFRILLGTNKKTTISLACSGTRWADRE